MPSDIGLKSKIPDRVSKREGIGKRSSSDAHNSLNIVSDNRQKVKHDPWSVMYLSQFSRLAMIWEGEAPAEPRCYGIFTKNLSLSATISNVKRGASKEAL